MRKFYSIYLLLFYSAVLFAGANLKVIQSDQSLLRIDLSFAVNSQDDLKPISILIGLPNNTFPELNVEYADLSQSNVVFSDTIPAGVHWLQKQKLRQHFVATLEVSPYLNQNSYYKKISIIISFKNSNTSSSPTFTAKDDSFFKQRVVNWEVARRWVFPVVKKVASTNELPAGQWLKFEVFQDDIHALDGNTILSMLPSNLNFDPRSLMLYTGSNLGRAMQQAFGIDHLANNNLEEIALLSQGFDDGSLDPADRFIFYGRGPSGFDHAGTEVDYNHNLYFNSNTYWLLIPDDQSLRGKRIETATSLTQESIQLAYGISHIHIENDVTNPTSSGLGWVDKSIANGTREIVNIVLPNPDQSVPATLRAGFIGGTANSQVRKFPSHLLRIYAPSSNNISVMTVTGVGMNPMTQQTDLNGSVLLNGSNPFSIANESNDQFSQPFIDFLTISYGHQLVYQGSSFEFFSPIHSNPVRFNLEAAITPLIWEITDLLEPINIPIQIEAGQRFIMADLAPQQHSRYIIFSEGDWQSISDLEFRGEQHFNIYRNQNIQTEHLIIGPQEFQSAGLRLADYRNNSQFFELEQIYNEFAGGNSDPMAIRALLEWTQQFWTPPAPLYLMLLGDADFDYRNITGLSQIKVPTIEVGIADSYATDDQLATINGNIPEFALGRFPARSNQEAEDFIDKLIAFETAPDLNPWRQRVLLVADDAARPEDSLSELYIGKSHTINSELLGTIIPSSIDLQKLYLLEYPEVSDASSFGVSKPQATQALFDYLYDGVAIINYIGHGSAHQWSQERLLYQDRGDVQLINTNLKLPLWIAGTCSWGHFDDLESESFSEELIRLPMNGASAIITTTRPITVTSNQFYETQLFSTIFPQGAVSNESIGMILQSVKTGNREGEYFHLFGDPIMKLAIPTNTITISNVQPDTLKTLGTATITGTQNITKTGGIGYLSLFDSEREVKREYNYLSTIQSIEYKLPGATLFRGKFDFTNDSFQSKLRIPKDIAFTSAPGKISIYSVTDDDPAVEALGYFDNIFFATGDETSDNQGPIISLETETRRILRNGDHLNENEQLFLRISDPLGVNLTGEIGHEIIVTDLSTEQSMDVTDQFYYDINSITTGIIPLDFTSAAENITIHISAWDNGNNPAESEISLTRLTLEKLKLFNVYNFPNPFSTETQFTFELTQPADVQISIFTISGRKIYQSQQQSFSQGFHFIDWNGKDHYGDNIANGVYLYKIKAVGDESSIDQFGRIAKYR